VPSAEERFQTAARLNALPEARQVPTRGRRAVKCECGRCDTCLQRIGKRLERKGERLGYWTSSRARAAR